MSELNKPSVPTTDTPVSHQVREAEASINPHAEARLAEMAAQAARPGTVIGAGDAGYAEALAGASRPGEIITPKLKRFAVELRYGPQMMSSSAEISATSIDTIMAAIMNQGGLRLTSKLPTSSPSGTSFQKGAFIFTQSIHSVVVLEELK